MVRLIMLACAALMLVWHAPVAAQQLAKVDVKEWAVEWGGRTRDPAVAPDGKVWFVGQQGNYIAWFDPKTEQFKRYEIEEGTNPHSINVDANGIVWYTGNRNGRIGRLDPNGGGLRVIMTGEATDPHTHIFDGKGNIWFTSQGANRIGRLNMKTEKVDLITPNETPSNPYGIVMDPQGNPWAMLLRTNTIAKIDPVTMAVTKFTQADPSSRGRRLDITADGLVWYVDEARGYFGRINPATKETKEWPVPGGPKAGPYALTKDDKGRLWFSEIRGTPQIVGFDPKTEQFFAIVPVSGAVRHMHFHAPTQAMWFGTDANKIGRIIVPRS